MDPDDLLPRKPKPAQRDLSTMSVDELHAYIGEMEAEIARVRTEIERKTAHKAAMENLFRKG
ncbi:MAG TPA: DUF1192 domain-containing protein [Azospirillaceae bacterium]|nr:DUF1192 domain-containing protein [Azospirillaceae bacterium]